MSEIKPLNLVENRNPSLRAPDHGSAIKAATRYIDTIDTRLSGELTLLSSHLPSLDERFPGWLAAGNLVIVAARPSMGKTALTQHLAEHVSESESVLLASFEMPEAQIIDRSVSRRTGLVRSTLMRPSEDDMDSIREGIREFSKLNFFIDDRPQPLSHFLADVRALYHHLKETDKPLKMMVVDYLQLIEAPGANRTEQVGRVSRELKLLALELDITVIALSQLNRDLEKRKHQKPLLSDLRESGSIEQDADVVIGLWRDLSPSGEPLSDQAEAIFLKNRHGERGTAELRWSGERVSFEDKPERKGPKAVRGWQRETFDE